MSEPVCHLGPSPNDQQCLCASTQLMSSRCLPAHTQAHSRTLASMQASIRTHTHASTHMHACMLTRTHACTHTCACKHTRTGFTTSLSASHCNAQHTQVDPESRSIVVAAAEDDPAQTGKLLLKRASASGPLAPIAHISIVHCMTRGASVIQSCSLCVAQVSERTCAHVKPILTHVHTHQANPPPPSLRHATTCARRRQSWTI